MIYKNFDEHITRKHAVVIKGWPLHVFDNPSKIGSQLELKTLLNAWKTGATRFHKMTVDEHVDWVEAHTRTEPPSTVSTHPPPMSLPLPPAAAQHNNANPTPVINPAMSDTPFIHFGPSAPPQSSTTLTPTASKKPQKTRSDKGKSRKRTTQIPGVDVFSANVV